MPERFTETLRAESEADWSHAVQHRFVNELIAGAVPDAVMARYLLQDHRFLDSFLVCSVRRLPAPTRSRVASSAWCRPRKTPISFGHSKRSVSPRPGAQPIPIRSRQ